MDKWELIWTVDDAYRMVSGIWTYFEMVIDNESRTEYDLRQSIILLTVGVTGAIWTAGSFVRKTERNKRQVDWANA